MNYDFDKVIDRTNTNSLKYDFAVERGRPADVLPLWVADMDFPAPQPVLDLSLIHIFTGASAPKHGPAPALIVCYRPDRSRVTAQ